MSFNFNGYKIAKISYINENSASDGLKNIHFEIKKVLVSGTTDKKNATILINSESTVSDKEKGEIYRKLDLETIFYFNLHGNEDTAEKELTNTGINICISIVRDIIRKITSIDYSGPIDVKPIDLPVKLKIENSN